MRVVVTGGAGFIGSHVTAMLLERGHDVLVLDDLSTGSTDSPPAGAALRVADVNDLERVVTLTCEFGADAVMHLAAQASVERSVEDPAGAVRTNIGGTVSMLQAAHAARCGTFVFASTSAVYGDPVRQPVREDDRIAPVSPYGVSKAAAEHLVRIMCGLWGIRFNVLRLGNVFGPGDRPQSHHVVTSMLDAIARGVPPVVEWDGMQAKDFVFVEDVACALLLALEQPLNDVFNIATGTSRSVNDVLAAICEVVGRPVVAARRPARPGDVRQFVMECEKARRVLGWSATVPFAIAVERTVSHRFAQQREPGAVTGGAG